MGAYFAIGRATLHSTYVPRVGEVCRHEQPDGIPDRLVVGDGKTAAPDLPSLQPLDLYARVQRLEEEPRRSQSLTTLLETIVNALMQQQFLPKWYKERLSATYKEFLNADAMLRERGKSDYQKNVEWLAPFATLDAAPAARAVISDSHECPPNVRCQQTGESRCAASGSCSGTGETPVSEPMPAFASGSGSVTPVSYAENDGQRVDYDTERAVAIAETIRAVTASPAPTPSPQATPPQGSVQGEGSVPCSRSENEPVAWIAVFDGDDADGEFVWPNAGLAREWASTRPGVEIAPLYLQPQPTLTDAEREAIGRAIDSLEGVEDLLPTAAVNDPADTLRGLLTRCAIGHQE